MHRLFMRDSMEKPKVRHYQYLFGPVRSRRLGVSLGVDLMPHKTCTLDCVYCECGKTTRKTLVRKEYIPTRDIMDELDDLLSSAPELDYVTFSGAGEPTLHSGIGEMIAFLKRDHPRYPVALLTNGTLFHNPRVRDEISDADRVIASLDAATSVVFKKVNRPHSALRVTEMIQGLVDFRQAFSHQFFIEIFLVPGLNDSDSELKALKSALGKIQPDSVHVNTLDRPGTEPWVKPAGNMELKRIAEALGGAGLIRFHPKGQHKKVAGDISDIQLMGTLLRRPCTAEDVAAIFDIDAQMTQDRLERFVADGSAQKKRMPRGTFYFRQKNVHVCKTG